MALDRYGRTWPASFTPLMVELACIQKGGKWTAKDGKECGAGLFEHYRNAQTLLWPDDDHHRWSDMILREILANTVTAILGPKDSGKTHGASKYGLTDYYAFPQNTLVLISSTDLRGLEMRVWGDLKMLHEEAQRRFPWLAGHVLESKHAICTDNLDEDNVRDMRKGIICIPCLSSQGQFVGLGRYVGMKQERRRMICDEVQFMREGFLDAPANMNSGDFKGVFLGNPLGMDDPLDKVSEPKQGWTSLPEPEKTTVWENRWLNGKTINLVGTDSPNFDPDTKDKFPYLINQRGIDNTVAFYTKDSLQYYSQCKGVRRSGINAHRVITRELCEQFHAFDEVLWKGTPLTKIAACDAAYGGVGGDRCIGGHIEFGEDLNGKIVIACSPPEIVPVSIRKSVRPEEQIAEWFLDYCNAHDIAPENFFYDATGRGSLGVALARIWSANVQPVEFGGVPTNRPVSLEFLIRDPRTHETRPKLCHEHYSKFVTELWFSARYVIEADQMRQLPPEVAREGYMREWIMTRGDKIEVEAKSETKKRMNRSPDMFDWLVTCIEGARRRGFKIAKLANEEESTASREWLHDLARKHREMIHRRDLIYT